VTPRGISLVRFVWAVTAAVLASGCGPTYPCRGDPYCVNLLSAAVPGETVARAGCHGKGRVPPPCQPRTTVRSLAELSRPLPVGTTRVTVEGVAEKVNETCDSSAESYRGGRYRCSSDIGLEFGGEGTDEIRLLRRGPRGPTPYRCEGDRTGLCCELPVDQRGLAVTVEVPGGPIDYVVITVCSLDQGKWAAR